MFATVAWVVVSTILLPIANGQITVCGNFPMAIPLFNYTDQWHMKENSNYGYVRAIAMKYTIEQCKKQYKKIEINDKYFAMLERHSLYLADQFQCDFLIGPFSSDNSERALSLYNLLDNELSFISVGATAKKLSNRRYYPKFFRTVPSDEYSTGAFMEMVKIFDWTNIAILYTPNDAALSAVDQFTFQMQKNGGCVMKTIIADDATLHSYRKTLTGVVEEIHQRKIRVLFLFLSHQGCFSLYETAKYLDNSTKIFLQEIQIILDPNCGANIPIIEEAKPLFKNMVTLQSENFIPSGFNEYFLEKINVTKWSRAILTRYAWVYRQCPPPKCKTPLIPPPTYTSITPVIEAVKLIVEAINETCALKNCKNLKSIDEKRVIRKELYNFLNKYQKKKENVTVHFSIDGGVSMNYDVFQLQRVGNETYDFIKVGHWNYWKWFIDSNQSLTMHVELNRSVCSEACHAHQIQVFNKTSKCCWSCETCTKTKIVQSNKCVSCDHGTKATDDQTSCKQIKVYSIENDHWLSVLVIVISTLFLIISLIILAIFLKHFNSSVIKSNSPELSLCTLVGIILMLVVPYVYVQHPSPAICIAQKLLFGFSITCCYAPLVIKTNRIYRIFMSAQNYTTSNDILSSVKSQLTMVVGMLATQLVVTSFWIMKDGSKPQIQYYPADDYGTNICSMKADSFILNIIFPLVLMVASTFWAFKTRHLPETFSEIKSIGVTMYVTLFLSMISLGLVFLFNGQDGLRMKFANFFVLCFAYQAIALINLIGQYGTKVKLIYGNHDQLEHEIEAGAISAVIGNYYRNQKRENNKNNTQIPASPVSKKRVDE